MGDAFAPSPSKIARFALLCALATLFVLPFLWMVGTSLTPPGEVIKADRPFFPRTFAWSNYSEALTTMPFHLFLKNTLTVAVLCAIGQTLTAASVAFAFARLKFPGREPLFVLVLSTMMLPPQVTMIPQFILFSIPGWVDSLKPLIIPAFFGGGAFYIFILRQFFLTIPKELEEAARLDGCNTFQVFLHVALPSARPALATVALFSFIFHWNDFLGPQIYTQSMEKKTLAVGLSAFKDMHGTEHHLLMAASVAVLLPVIVIFFFTQRYFTEGVVMSGVKG
ncbi:MAG: multiple sugar transport system permease protein [Phycisphaerales bacterium]|jgi:multiple sugar transport system permease protein|nr:multiple sugar transport system permease protein [Phycisphaerales bacterium]